VLPEAPELPELEPPIEPEAPWRDELEPVELFDITSIFVTSEPEKLART
jgi:hypothetical protein